ncbi:MAG: hypothetical protein AAFY08_14440 [Planctomycetota bacterium]
MTTVLAHELNATEAKVLRALNHYPQTTVALRHELRAHRIGATLLAGTLDALRDAHLVDAAVLGGDDVFTLSADGEAIKAELARQANPRGGGR